MIDSSTEWLQAGRELKALLEKHLGETKTYQQSDQRFHMGAALSKFQDQVEVTRDSIGIEYQSNSRFRQLKEKPSATLSINELAEVFRGHDTRDKADSSRRFIRRKQIEMCLLFVIGYPEKKLTIVFQRNAISFCANGEELYSVVLDSPNEEVYLAYYWRHKDEKREEHVGYGVVQVPLDEHKGPDWKQTAVTLLYASTPPITLKTIQGEVSGGLLYLWLEDSMPIDNVFVRTQITLNYSETRNGYLMGTYSTAHRRPREATAGIMVWRRMKSMSEAMIHIQTYQINDLAVIETGGPDGISLLSNGQAQRYALPIEINYFLDNQRLDVKRKVYGNIRNIPFAEEAKLIEQYVGVYQGYTIGHNNRKVILFRLEVIPSGKVVCKYENHSNRREYYGSFDYIGKSIRIKLDYQPEEDLFRQLYLLRPEQQTISGAACLVGLVSGLSRDLKHPVAGRVILQKLVQNTQTSHEIVSEAIIQHLSIADFRMYEGGNQYLAVLAGKSVADEERPMTDSFVPSLLVEAVEINQRPTTFSWSGNYYCFIGERLGSDPYSTKKYQLLIDEDGSTVLVREDAKWHGVAELTNNRELLIRFKQSYNSFVGTLLFTISESGKVAHPAKFKRLFGVLSRALDGRVEAFAAVLIPTRDEEKKREKGFNPPIPTEFQRLNTRLRIGNVDTFDHDDQYYGGLLSFMEGAANRSLRMEAVPDRPFRPRQKEFRRVGFYAACYLAQRHYLKTEEERKVLAHNKNGQNDEDALKFKENAIDRVQEIKTHLSESFKMGFAAEQFAGVKLSARHLDVEAVQQDFMMADLGWDHSVDQLVEDIKAILEDRSLLLEALRIPTCLNQQEIMVRVKTLWPHITALLEPKKAGNS